MKGKFFLAWVVIFVLGMVLGMVVHGMILKPDYDQVRQLLRTETEAQAKFPWMILAHIVYSGAFVWIYSRGLEAKPWLAQGKNPEPPLLGSAESPEASSSYGNDIS